MGLVSGYVRGRTAWPDGVVLLCLSEQTCSSRIALLPERDSNDKHDERRRSKQTTASSTSHVGTIPGLQLSATHPPRRCKAFFPVRQYVTTMVFFTNERLDMVPTRYTTQKTNGFSFCYIAQFLCENTHFPKVMIVWLKLGWWLVSLWFEKKAMLGLLL